MRDGKKIVKILFVILAFYNACFSMQQKHIPTLREIAFKQATTEINQRIDVISDGNNSILEKLKKIHDVIDVYGLPKWFVKNHQQINKLIEEHAVDSHNNMQSDPGNSAKLWNSFNSMTHFRKKLQGEIAGSLLRQDRNILPPLPIVSVPLYAFCLLNNRMLFMPVSKIVTLLCGESSLLSVVQYVESEAAKIISKNHQLKISELQSNVHNDNQLLNYTFQSHMVNKYDASPTITISSDMQQYINDINIVYSPGGKKIMFTEMNKFIIYNVGENLSTCTTITISYPIKKACFSADDSTIFGIGDGRLFTYDICQAIFNEWPMPNIIAIYPTHGKDFLIIECHGDKFELRSVKIENLRLFTLSKNTYALREPADITAACFSKNGKWIAIGCRNGQILLRNTAKNREKSVTLENSEAVTRLIFSPCSSFFTAIINERTVSTWHCASGSLIKEFCPQVVHTIKAHNETGLLKGEKSYNYCLPMILLSLAIDGSHPIIQELCDSNRAEGWQKVIDPLELISQLSVKK